MEAATNVFTYDVTENGHLYWYRNADDTPIAEGWAPGSGTVIGKGGWAAFKQIAAAPNGVIYAVTQDGNLLWYRYTKDTPVAEGWAAGSGTVIGQDGWAAFKQIVAAPNGVIYVVTHDGNLLSYRYTK